VSVLCALSAHPPPISSPHNLPAPSTSSPHILPGGIISLKLRASPTMRAVCLHTKACQKGEQVGRPRPWDTGHTDHETGVRAARGHTAHSRWTLGDRTIQGLSAIDQQVGACHLRASVWTHRSREQSFPPWWPYQLCPSRMALGLRMEGLMI
jgi:hypothetical protein